MQCRNCKNNISLTLLDLGKAPPCNDYVSSNMLNSPETFYPLRVVVCEHCWLVQTTQDASSDSLFRSDYAYFSSTSKSWLKHAYDYTEEIRSRLSLNADSFVVEVASNDGYLLKNFVDAGIPCMGIEPTASTAAAARMVGVETVEEFLGEEYAFEFVKQYGNVDLLVGNNVFAHVPDIVDFSRGMFAMLKPDGVITLEFPHLLNLIRLNQWDTVYHEHFSYLSLHAVTNIFDKVGLKVFDVDNIKTHGGSLRLYVCRADANVDVEFSVTKVLEDEETAGICSKELYQNFQSRVDLVRDNLVNFLIDCKAKGKVVVGYGAAGKGNTFLNYSGVRSDLLPVIFDAAPSKQGMWTPGLNIPIEHPDRIQSYNPDYVWILPWNIKEEVKRDISVLTSKPMKFITTSPSFEIS